MIHHVLKNVLWINTDERVSFSIWVEYNGYPNIHELCKGLQYRLKDPDEYSDYIVNGQHFALEPFTMHKIKWFTSWISTTRTKETTFQLSSQYLLSLTYQDLKSSA